MERSPPPFIWACPEERDILNCELAEPLYRQQLIQCSGHFIIVSSPTNRSNWRQS